MDYCIVKLIPIFVVKNSEVVYQTNKRKIINDPVYGFINIPGDFVFDLIEHPWFQRSRNIKAAWINKFCHPGATHRLSARFGSFAPYESGYCHTPKQRSHYFRN